MSLFLELLIFILPAYFANASPVILGGGTPMDFKKKFSDGVRILGDGKTIRGFFGGIAVGIIAAGIIAYVYPLGMFGNMKMQFFSGVLLSVGTLVGDVFGSFMKRRMKVSPGKPFLMDQISFLIVALLLAYPISPLGFYSVDCLLFLLVITFALHIFTNFLANKLGLKKVPW